MADDVFPRFKTNEKQSPKRRSVMGEQRRTRFVWDEGLCQADGLHHPECPIRLDNEAWSCHHVLPRHKGGGDELENLITVWNGATRFGAGGCHQRIHDNPRLARCLGLLSMSEDDRFYACGLAAGIEVGLISEAEAEEARRWWQ